MHSRSLGCAAGLGLLLLLTGCPADQVNPDQDEQIQGGDGTEIPTDGGPQQDGTGSDGGQTPPPSATALAISTGGNVNATLGAQATVTGIVASGTPPFSYLWEQISGPAATIGDATTAIATVTTSEPGIVVLRLTVTDATGATASAEVTVTITAGSLSPGVLVVRQGATGANNGTSWFDAFNSLQDAIAAARVPGSNIREIWVAAGTYRPAGPGGNRNISFDLLANVAIYGGFAGTETHFTQRDLSANRTILSGDLNSDDRIGFGNMQDNSEHVVTADGIGAGAVLDGFTVSNGNAQSSSGGGLAVSNSSVTVRNCTFRDNSAGAAGGGVSLSNSPGTILVDCVLRFNQSLGNGGGLSMTNSNALIRDCTVGDNVAIDGGGAWISGGSPNLTGCLFARNAAQNAGGIRSNADLLQLANCTFDRNSAGSGDGGGIATDTPFSAVNCIFTRNSAGNGGGVNASSNGVSLFGCLFDRNTAAFGAGALLSGTSPELINCTLSGNTATNLGGGLRLTNATGFVGNCILWGNVDVNGSVESSQISLTVDPDTFRNQVRNCDVQEINVFAARNGNISADPLFIDAASGDLRLSGDSPCIGAGNNALVPPSLTTDLNGGPRIQGVPPVVDMGAYER